jgi:hypothetical protein
MDYSVQFDAAPLLAFYHQYGATVLGAAIVLAAFGSRRLGPMRFLAAVLGLGMVLTGFSNLLPR